MCRSHLRACGLCLPADADAQCARIPPLARIVPAQGLAESEQPVDLHPRRHSRHVRLLVECERDHISLAVTGVCGVGVGGDEGGNPGWRAPITLDRRRDGG